MAETYKRRFGDRRDGRWLRDEVPGLQSIMAHLWPNRTDCEVCVFDKLDATELMKYLEKKNSEHPDYRTTAFQCFLLGVARMINERPKMNRFIAGRRFYERYDISLSFVAKRRFEDHSEESLMFFTPDENETIDTFSYKVGGRVHEMRKSEHSTGGIDALLDSFARLPRILLMLITRIVRWLDFWGINPKALTDGDPNYSTMLASNLGSIKAPTVYHHLNNYGTLSLMSTFGELHKEIVVMEDGHSEERTMVDISATMDERIADGFYFAKSLKLLKYIFLHPDLLDIPLSTPSGFDY